MPNALYIFTIHFISIYNFSHFPRHCASKTPVLDEILYTYIFFGQYLVLLFISNKFLQGIYNSWKFIHD